MIKAFFFDLDGTLVDTHQANFEAYRLALADFGVTITMDDFKKTIGHQAQTFLPWLAPGLKADDYQEIAKLKVGYYREAAKKSVANERLITFLHSVQPHHKMALVTTAKRANAMAVLEHHKLDKTFDLIITAEDVSISKPSPECYKMALAEFALEPTEALAFEDSLPGVEAAETAGIPVVMVRDFQL